MGTYEFTGDKKKFKDLLETISSPYMRDTADKIVFDLFSKYVKRVINY